MKIAIVGSGAMGCLFGAKLSTNPNNEVYLIDVWQDHIDSINSNGILMEENGEQLVFDRVKSVADSSTVGHCDLAIIFVKSTLTKTAVEMNKAVFGTETVAITLQNGLGNVDIISDLIGKENVIAGTTAHGATVLGPGLIKHAGIGKTIIGELDGAITPRIESIMALLNEAKMESDITDNVIGNIWDKLLVNVGINALTAITKLHNGELLDYPETEKILEDAVLEAQAVANAKGIKLNFNDSVGHTKDVCKATFSNKSSMLQDILNHRQTEVDMINGAIVKAGLEAGVETPVNSVLTGLIKVLQKTV